MNLLKFIGVICLLYNGWNILVSRTQINFIYRCVKSKGYTYLIRKIIFIIVYIIESFSYKVLFNKPKIIIFLTLYLRKYFSLKNQSRNKYALTNDHNLTFIHSLSV